jgi:Lectin C-type domain
LTASLAKPVEHSPAGAAEFDGHRYKVFQNLGISWQQAKLECEQMGGRLACPVTPEQLDFINNLNDSEGMWLGGYFDKGGNPPEWKWLTGEAIDRRETVNSGAMWLCTTGRKGSLIARMADGAFHLEGGNTMLRDFTNIQGFICDWPANATANKPSSAEAD